MIVDIQFTTATSPQWQTGFWGTSDEFILGVCSHKDKAPPYQGPYLLTWFNFIPSMDK